MRVSTLHERNVHRDGYNMKRLIEAFPALQRSIILSKAGVPTIDFANEHSVTLLNQALLATDYKIQQWKLPSGYLCPSVPGRADYIHYVADLMASHNSGIIPRGQGVKVLDIGVGANVIYPIVGIKSYDWSYVGSDIDITALQSAREIIESNPSLSENLTLRPQKNNTHYFKGIVGNEDEFDLVVCNPPYYASEKEANEATARKWKNLGKSEVMGNKRTFGGKSGELFCEGGEVNFIRKMIEESFFFARRCYWFTTLVSRQEHMHSLHKALHRLRPAEVQVIQMTHGQKSSRILAWTLMSNIQRSEWRARRFWQ